MLGQIYVMFSHGYCYVGKHDGNIFNDNYFGSGVAWNNVVNKYGKECIERNIICTYETKEEGNNLEMFYIDKYKNQFKECCLNIAIGGKAEILVMK